MGSQELAEKVTAGSSSIPHTLLCCPCCRAELDVLQEPRRGYRCTGCGNVFQARDGYLPLMPTAGASQPHVQGFYEQNPFPDYEDLDSPRALRERAARSLFARRLDECLPTGGTTLEAGCGTGQLTNYLALSQRSVIGLDFCERSLRLGAGFRSRFRIHHAGFVQGDLFHLPFREHTFDQVISLGVLHQYTYRLGICPIS